MVWGSQNELSKSPPLISSSKVDRGEPPLFRSGCPAGIMKELENVMPLDKITSVFSGRDAYNYSISYISYNYSII